MTSIEKNIKITVSDDNLVASIEILDDSSDSFPQKQVILNTLTDNNIICGVDITAIEHLVHKKNYNTPFEIARGIEPINSQQEYFSLHPLAHRSEPPFLFHKALGTYPQFSFTVTKVVQGDPILRLTPEHQGENGVDIYGATIFSAQTPPPAEQFFIGKGIHRKNVTDYCAAHDGFLHISSKNEVSVLQTDTISNEGFSLSSPLKSEGNLHFEGAIAGEIHIEVQGTLLVEKGIEDSTISAHGDIRVANGIVGVVKGKILSQKSLFSNHIEKSTICTTGNIYVNKHIIYSTISCDAIVYTNTIFGGFIDITHGLEAKVIGSESETKTIIKLGNFEELQNQYDEIGEDISFKKNKIFKIKNSMYTLVKDSMEPQSGELNTQNTTILTSMKDELSSIQTNLRNKETLQETLQDKLSTAPTPYIKAETIYPNTIIQYGSKTKVIDEKLSNVVISYDKKKLTIRHEQ